MRRTAVQLLLLVAALGAGTRGEQEDLSDRVARQTQRDLELSQIRLDPTDCPGGGDGMVYVALRDVVVRVPYSKDHPVGRNPIDSGAGRLTTPPMPDAPEGCKEHPAPAQALHLSRQLQMIAQSEGHVAPPLKSLSMFRSDGRAHMQEVNENSFDRARTQGKCTNSPSGLTICGWREDDSRVARGVQIAGGDVAGGPRWVAVCGLGPSIHVDDCRVHYLLRKGMAVGYVFNQRQVSLDRMFELDPLVRNWLNSIVVES